MSRVIAEEAEQYGDLLLVPTPDVYRALPDKLLLFLNWYGPIYLVCRTALFWTCFNPLRWYLSP